MKKRLVTLVKLALVAALMVWVFRGIDFVDHLRWRIGDDPKVVAEQVIDIVGGWKQEPVVYTLPGETVQRTATRGATDDGRTLAVEPGFLTYWHNLDPWLFGLGALCYFLTALIAGARWWWLLKVNGTDVSLAETLRFTWIGIFFNNVVPGATGGDVVKALYIMKRCPGHRVQVLMSVVVDRVLGLGSLALLGAIVVLFSLDKFAEIAIGIWGVILGVGLLGLVAFSRRLRQLVRLKALLDRLPPKLGHLLKKVDHAVFVYRERKTVIVASLVAGVGNHVLAVLSVVCIGNSLDIGMPSLEYFVLIPVINIVTAVPLAPNGWGIGESLYSYFFGQYGWGNIPGVPEAVAKQTMGTRGLALSVLYRLHVTLWSLFGGLLTLFEKDKVTRADIEREVAQEAEDDVVDDQEPADPAHRAVDPQHPDR